jgi:polar amino acid transport system substrate-binding protein
LVSTTTRLGRGDREPKLASTRRIALSAFLAITLGACAPPGAGVVKTTPSALAITSPNPPAITPPTNLVRPGTLTFLSDTTYPPQESIDPSTQQPVGFDIDVAQAIAAKMGLSATIQNTNSPQIVGALLAKKGDAIISALQITPDLERQVALIAYFEAGQSILVRKGNPAAIGGLSDLCGKKVSVQVQSPEENTIDEANAGICKDSKINKQVYPTDLQAVLILKQQGVQAAMDDSPVAAYFVKQTPDQLDLAGPPLKTNPEGIAVDPKNGELLGAIQKAMMAIYKDGTYRQILTKWNLLDGEISASQIVVNPSPTTS